MKNNMKQKMNCLLLVLLIISCSMTGCSLKNDSAHEHDITMKTLSIHALPFVDNESIKNGNKTGEKIEIDMSQAYPDEDYRPGYSRGMVSDYILHDGYMYYLVYYRAEEFVWPNQVVIFRQDIENGMVEYMFHHVYDSPFMTLTGIKYNENLEWYRQDSSEIIYHDTLKDGEIVTRIPSIEEAYGIDVEPIDWQNGIKEELLTGDIYLTLDSDEYIVWDQFENPDNYYEESYINIYNKASGEYSRIDKKEYGGYFRYAPVAYGNILVFICGQDIKSYTNKDDSFNSVYYVELDTMESHLLVKGSGSHTNDLAFKTFDAIKQNDGYIYFESLTNPYSETIPQDAQPYDTMYIISQ